jgi:cation transport regulator
MPYGKKSELPSPVKDNLPTGAQDVYMAAFNFASKKKGFADDKASQYAWGAVGKVYEKKDNKWVKKSTQQMSISEEDTEYLNADLLLEMATQLMKDSCTPDEEDDWDMMPDKHMM